MFLDKFKYRTTFTSLASIVAPVEANISIASSLDSLRGIFPKEIDINNSPDLLGFVANGAVAGLANKNADLISPDDTIKIAPLSLYRYISVEHQRNNGGQGVIIGHGYSKFGSNEIISVEEAKDLSIFNWAVSGLIWETLSPGLVRYLIECSTPGTKNYCAASLSWELFFSDYKLLVGSKNLAEGEIVDSTQELKFLELQKYLKANGGTGKIDSTGENIYRLIVGEMLPGGFSITNSPAAEVCGILPITEDTPIENLDNINARELIRISANNIEIDSNLKENNEKIKKSVNNDNTENKKSVNNNTDLKNKPKNKYMKFKSIKEITAEKLTSLASNDAGVIADALNEFFDKYAEDLDSKTAGLSLKEKEAKDAKAALDTAQKKIDDFEKQLQASEAARVEEKTKNDLTIRLNDLVSRFELNEKGIKAIAKQIKGLDDENYNEWLEFAEATFAVKASDEDDSDEDDEDDDDENDDDGKGMGGSKYKKGGNEDEKAENVKKAKKAAKDKAKASDEEDFDFESIIAKAQKGVANTHTRGARNLKTEIDEAFKDWDKELGLK